MFTAKISSCSFWLLPRLSQNTTDTIDNIYADKKVNSPWPHKMYGITCNYICYLLTTGEGMKLVA